MKVSKLFSIISAVLIFTGCAKYIKSEVVVFHKFPELQGTVKYAFQVSKSQEEDLEYITYRDLIKNELAGHRFEEVPFDEAEMIVLFEYSIDRGREIIRTSPVYGETGVLSSTTYGNIKEDGGNTTYYETTTYTPSYGRTGSQIYTVIEFVRSLTVRILDKSSFYSGKPELLYKANVVSKGEESRLVKIIPAMVKSLFRKFPGKSGSTRSEKIFY